MHSRNRTDLPQSWKEDGEREVGLEREIAVTCNRLVGLLEDRALFLRTAGSLCTA